MNRRLRAWPVLLVLVAAAIALGWIWLTPELMRQFRVIGTMLTGIATAFLLLVWLALFSGLPARSRLAATAAAAGVVLAAVALFRIRGVSGDFVPMITFRWDREWMRPAEPAPNAARPAMGAAEPQPGLADFPQFLGPERRNVVRGVRLARDWTRSPPRLVWRQPIGAGWSAFATLGGLAYTLEQQGEEEVVSCYEARTGELVWRHADRARYETTIAGIGPRSTPTLAGGRVYTLGATGILNSLRSDTGERVWTRQVVAENGAAVPEWGKSCSPLVHGDLVVVSAGGRGGRSLVAYRRQSGDFVWGGGDDPSGYASPFVATLAGREQIVILNAASVVSHDSATGEVLWRQPWPGKFPKVAQPLALAGDRVFVTSGYGVGCALFGVAATGDGALEVKELWRNRNLKAKFANVVEHEGAIYGLDDGILVCIDLASGERRWKGGRYGHGQLLLVEDLILVTTEHGTLVLIDPDPEEPRVLGEVEALGERTWQGPALAGRLLLVRNDQEAACYEVEVE